MIKRLRNKSISLIRIITVALLLGILPSIVPVGEAYANLCSEEGEECTLDNGDIGICDKDLSCNPYTHLSEGTCTTDNTFKIPDSTLISTIIYKIQNVLNPLAKRMFEAIATDTGFKKTVYALATLYVAIYGILFTFAMVQITVYDFAMRLIKIGIIVMLLSPTAWNYFNGTVIEFFNRGTDHIINYLVQLAIPVGTNAINGPKVAQNPFVIMDAALAQVVSAKMAITLIALFLTGPYGPIIGLLLLMSLGSFLKAVVNALWVYVMSLIIRTLLFGIAPIFIICLLFGRTRHLFDGWLNQIVNACLQPIMLFAFFAFFVTLILACVAQILTVPVCWTEWAEPFRGSASSMHFWRFAVPDGTQPTGWAMYDKVWGWLGAAVAGGPISPISIVLPLTMFILSDLAGRFIHMVVEIAKDLANAATDLRMGLESISEWFRGGGIGESVFGGGAGGAAGRGGAGIPLGGAAAGRRPLGPGGGGGSTGGGSGGGRGGASPRGPGGVGGGLDKGRYAPGTSSGFRPRPK